MKGHKTYTGKYLELFHDFLVLADDLRGNLNRVSALLPWKNVINVLSIGGGGGEFELSLLKDSPNANLWYFDPSPEQCKTFAENSKKHGLADRVKDVTPANFQNYRTNLTFERIVSSFSWFYIGTELALLKKLLALLAYDGVAIILMQDEKSLEAIFNKMLCPNPKMALTGQEIYRALEKLPCSVEFHRQTKWVPQKDLFIDGGLTPLAKAFAAFIAQKTIEEISSAEWARIYDVFNLNCGAPGAPMITDILVVRKA